jgi:hypothetical protein
VVGSGTSFVTTLKPNCHVRAQNGTQFVVNQVVNNTFLTAFATVSVVAANTFSVIPVGTITSLDLQAQQFYGKIRSVRLLTNGNGYQTPPVATADGVAGRAQELFLYDPGTRQHHHGGQPGSSVHGRAASDVAGLRADHTGSDRAMVASTTSTPMP